MIASNEVIGLILAIAVLVFYLWNRPRLRELPAFGILLAAFLSLLVGLVLTILEGVFWQETLNLLEHVGYALSALLLAVWCWFVFGKRRSPS
jgi:hypothetical protein